MEGAFPVEDWLGLSELRQDVERALRHRCPDRHELDDLVQETLMKAARCRPSLQQPARLRAWVIRIAWNVFNDHVRRERVMRGKNMTGEEFDEFQEIESLWGQGAADERFVLDGAVFEVSELVQLVRALVDELTTAERGLYRAFYLEGLGCAITAERLGISRKGAKMRLVRLRRKLKRSIRQRVAAVQVSPGQALEALAC